MITFKDLQEKKLTKAELKKREEIAKAIEKDQPGMDMGKKMAIATAAAKRVAEDIEELEEGQKENVQAIEEALPANFDPKSKAHQHARSATKGWKEGAKAEYHKDGSATIHTKSIHGTVGGKISSTTIVDNLHKDAGLDHNRSEADYKNNSEKDKKGLTHTTKQVDKDKHTIHIKESVKLTEGQTEDWAKIQAMDKGSLVSGKKEDARKRLEHLKAVRAHHKKYGNDVHKVTKEIERINRSRVAESEELDESVIRIQHKDSNGNTHVLSSSSQGFVALNKGTSSLANVMHSAPGHASSGTKEKSEALSKAIKAAHAGGKESVLAAAKKATGLNWSHHSVTESEELEEGNGAYMAAVAAMPAAAYVGAKLGAKLHDLAVKRAHKQIDASNAKRKATIAAKKVQKEDVDLEEGKHEGTIAAMAKSRYTPEPGHKIVTKKGGQIPGTVEKLEKDYVYFRHPEGKLFRTHKDNVQLDRSVKESEINEEFEVWEKAINPVTKQQRFKSGKDQKVASFQDIKKAQKHAANLGGERYGVYVKKSVLKEAAELDEARIPQLPRRHFFDTYGGTNGIAYTDNKRWWKIADGKVVDFTDSPEGTKSWKVEFVAKQKAKKVQKEDVDLEEVKAAEDMAGTSATCSKQKSSDLGKSGKKAPGNKNINLAEALSAEEGPAKGAEFKDMSQEQHLECMKYHKDEYNAIKGKTHKYIKELDETGKTDSKLKYHAKMYHKHKEAV